jgi:hypothetical protein
MQTILNGSLRSRMANCTQQQREELSTALSLELEQVAKVYCGAPKTDGAVFGEGMMFIMESYSDLGLGEIRAAFRYVNQHNRKLLTAYHGIFTVAMLGDVLQYYRDNRKPFFDQAAKMTMTETLELESRTVEGFAESTLGDLLQVENPTLDDVSGPDFAIMEKAGFLTLDKKTKWDYMKKAEPIVRQQFRQEKEQANIYQIKEITKALDLGPESDKFVLRQRTIAKRLAVLDFIKSDTAKVIFEQRKHLIPDDEH